MDFGIKFQRKETGWGGEGGAERGMSKVVEGQQVFWCMPLPQALLEGEKEALSDLWSIPIPVTASSASWSTVAYVGSPSSCLPNGMSAPTCCHMLLPGFIPVPLGVVVG